ncbi:hypothetical protein ACFQL7_27690 [Halocatena marina]|uniref:Uncharacterized protein n=1 Tax=Halocatena marina TaxID=2934937 RepID=A0ABD5YVC3_9EURY
MNDEDYRWVSIHDLRRCWANQLVVADRISPRTVIAFLLMGNGTVMSRQKAVLVGLLLILTVVFTASGFARARLIRRVGSVLMLLIGLLLSTG